MEILLRTLFIGVVTGSVYALASTGLVLTYRTSGILNLGYGALAVFTTFIHYQLALVWGWPLWLSALLVILVIAPLLGALLDVTLFRRLIGQPTVILIISTVGLWVLLQGLVYFIWRAETRIVPSLFPTNAIEIIGGARIGVDQIAVFAVAIGSALILAAFLRYTRWGVALRAVVDNREVAGLMSINTGLVSASAWALGTSFAAMTGILLTPTLLLDPVFLPPFIIAFVLGAAIVGYLRSLPMAFAGGILIGILQALLIQYGDFKGVLGNLEQAAPFLIMTLLIVFAPKSVRLSGERSFVVRGRRAVERVPGPAAAWVGVAVFGGLALVPALTGGSITWLLALTDGLIFAIVSLSLVILTGYSGQVSLGHTAFMGIAAFTAGHLATSAGMSPWLALFLGALAAVPAGALVGLIAVRLSGLFLALMTLAFAFMAQELFFAEPTISGVEGSIAVPQPPGATGDVSFYYLVLGILGACALIAVTLRTGRTGRVLAALRDSETATRALGINVVKYKTIIFGLSAFMAAFGGILASMTKEAASRLDFLPFFSLIFVTLAVIGGLFHVGGAIVAGLFYALYPKVFEGTFMIDIQLILFGLGATYALAREPEGIFGEMRRGGAALYRLFGRLRRPRAAVAETRE